MSPFSFLFLLSRSYNCIILEGSGCFVHAGRAHGRSADLEVKKMSYDEFNELVRSRLCDICGEDFSVSVYEALKNNSVVHKGISIKDNSSNIAPTIYMDEFYTDYCDGRDIEDIVHEILRIYSENRPGPEIETGRFQDFEWIKDRIFFKVINAGQNSSLLKQVPYSPFLDLAVVYGVFMGDYRQSFSSVLIRNEHLEMWHADEKAIRKHAIKNTPSILPSEICRMQDMLEKMGLSCAEDAGSAPMFILSNKNKVNGAGAMLYEGVLKTFSEELGSDLYILPSSVHEVIIIPKSEAFEPGELKNMIAEVNDTQLAAEEILSYSLYEYTRKEGVLDIVYTNEAKKVANL